MGIVTGNVVGILGKPGIDKLDAADFAAFKGLLAIPSKLIGIINRHRCRRTLPRTHRYRLLH